MSDGTLYYGDCLDILRGRDLNGDRYIKDESVDLITIDPPFNSDRVWNVIFKEPDGHGAASQIKGFDDAWTWNDDVAKEYEDLKALGGKVADTMVGLEKILGFSNMFAYLVMMASRLVEMRRALKSTGSIYLHCDQTAGHYIKIVMDAIFGVNNFRNEIVWCYAGGGIPKKDYPRKHDTIFRYSKSDDYKFNVEYRPYSPKNFGTHSTGEKLNLERGTPVNDWWPDIGIVSPLKGHKDMKLGYPTQKPEALLERIIKASSNEGDVVLDTFAGCGTCIAVAQRLGRHWIGIDITAIAINVIKARLKDSCPNATYTVIGEPATPEDARRLADSGDPDARYQFQLWALGLDGARPVGKLKKGADKGVDGKRYFEVPGKTELIVYSVKSGHVNAKDVRDLARVVQRENAAIGVLIGMEDITGPMKTEAASAGQYKAPGLEGDTYAKVQLYTVEELMKGTKVQWPRYLRDVTYKKAVKFTDKEEPARYGKLGDSEE